MNAAEQGKQERAASLGTDLANHLRGFTRGIIAQLKPWEDFALQSTGGLEWEEFGCNVTVPTGTIVVARTNESPQTPAGFADHPRPQSSMVNPPGPSGMRWASGGSWR